MEQALEGFSIEERKQLLPLLRRLGRTAESAVADGNRVLSGMVNGAQPESRRGARRSSK
jgi:hypothetical protein